MRTIKGFEIRLSGKNVELLKNGNRKAEIDIYNIYKAQVLESSEVAVRFFFTWDELKNVPGIKLAKDDYEYIKNLYNNTVQEYLEILNAQDEILIKKYQGHYYLAEKNVFKEQLTNSDAERDALAKWLEENKNYLVASGGIVAEYEATTYLYTYKKDDIEKIEIERKKKHQEHIQSAEYRETEERINKLFKWASEYDDRTFNELTGEDRNDYIVE